MLRYAILSVVGIDITPNVDFVGSALRGCLGYALRKTVCVFPLLDCKKYEKSTRCPFLRFTKTATKAQISALKSHKMAVLILEFIFLKR